MKANVLRVVLLMIVMFAMVSHSFAQVSGTPITTVGAAQKGCLGTATIPITVTQFSNIATISLTLNYPNQYLNFVSGIVTNIPLGWNCYFNSNSVPGQLVISMAWGPYPGGQQNGQLIPWYVEDGGEICLLNFTISPTAPAGPFNLTWDVGNCEYASASANQPLCPQPPCTLLQNSANYVNGSFTQISGTPSITCPGNITQVHDQGGCTAVVNWMNNDTEILPSSGYSGNACTRASYVWQSFTSVSTGILTGIGLTISDVSGNPQIYNTWWTYKIYKGEGTTGCPLYSGNFNATGLAQGTAITLPVPKSTGLYVIAGEKYTFSLQGTCTQNDCNSACVDVLATYNTGWHNMNGLYLDNTGNCVNGSIIIIYPVDDISMLFSTNVDVVGSNMTVSDGAGGTGIEYLTTPYPSGSTFPEGTTTVNYTATDYAGNTATCSFNVTVTGSTITYVASQADPTCPDLNNGSITVTASGGVGPYTYVLSPGSISNSDGHFTELTAGNYTVLITDAHACYLTTSAITLNLPARHVHDVTAGHLGDFCTIQQAINAAYNNDVIDVDAGTYPENLTINKSLTINGAGEGATFVVPPSLISTGIGHRWATNVQTGVFVNGAGAVTLENMTIDGNTLPNYDAVIFWNASSGTLNNLIVRADAIFSSMSGHAVAVDASSPDSVNLSITNCNFPKWNRNAIDAVNGNGSSSGGGNMTVNISYCTLTGRNDPSVELQNGINMWNVAGGTVTGTIDNVAISYLMYSDAAGWVSYGIAGPDNNGVVIKNSTISHVTGYISAGAGNIDASFNNYFDLVNPTISATLPQLFNIEDLIEHHIDDPNYGFVLVFANNVYVTVNSTDPIYGYPTPDIQRGIDAAGTSGWTVNVGPGTFHCSMDIHKSLMVLGFGKTSTFVDRSSDATAGNIVNIHDLSGNVTVEDFSITTGPASDVASSGIYVGGITGSGTITITNNQINTNPSPSGTAYDNFGLRAGYLSDNRPSLLFDRNTVNGAGGGLPNGTSEGYGKGNPILIERWLGPCSITNNTINRGPNDATSLDAIFMMNHSGPFITTPQIISGNTIDMGGGTVFTSNTMGTGITIASVGEYYGTTASGFTNVLISLNNIINLKDYRRGIGTWNDAPLPGTAGDITNLVISYNSISNAAGSTGQYGIDLLGLTTAPQITNNAISGTAKSVSVRLWNDAYATGVTVHNNSLLASVYAIENPSTNLLNGTCNWYGSIVPATIAGKIYGTVTYIPWLTDGTNNTTGDGFLPLVACSDPCNIILSQTHVDVNCPLVPTGSINLTVTNAIDPVSYSWTGPNNFQATTKDISNLYAGAYSVTVTGANGCTQTLSVTLILVDHPAPVVPVPGSSTVQCVSAVTTPTPPAVTDYCGTLITPALISTVDVPNPVVCQGTITYTYRYTDYQNKFTDWIYTYTIQHSTPPAQVGGPVSSASTVQCWSSATAPTPPVFQDVCGNVVTPTGPVVSGSANSNASCSGTVIYTYTYTDCALQSSTWVYTYTLLHTTAPAQVGTPVPTASTVQCSSSATAPTILPVVQDVCGNTLTPPDPIEQISYTNNFSMAVTLGPTEASGIWYVDRYAPNGFTSPVSFDGGDRLKESINASDYQGSGSFYNTQGRAYDVGTATNYVEIKLYVPEAWQTSNQRLAGLWGVAVDNTNAVSAYPIVEFTSDGNNPRFHVWEISGGWVDIGLPAGFAYNTWVTLSIRLLPTGEFLCSAGSLSYVTTTATPPNSVRFKSVILQGYNNDSSFDIYWDDFTWNDTYASICEGNITYTYMYADCAGLLYPWVYTYTVSPPALTIPAGGSSTVACASNATAPIPPTVTSYCGGPVTMTGPIEQLSYTNNFSRGVTLGATEAPGVWYVDRYAPNGFTSPVSYGGGDRLEESINASDYQGSGSFYNTQGRDYDLGTATDYMEIKLFVPSTWQTSNSRMAGLWGVAVDNTNSVSGYPIVEFTSDGGIPRFHAWESGGNGGWVDMGLPAGFAYNTWVTLSIRLLPTGEFLCSAGSLSYITKTSAPDHSVKFKSVILQGYNNNSSYDIYWDDFTWNDTYASICQGAITYTYLYTACDGLSYPWVYTYTIAHTDPPAEFGEPVQTSSMVSCWSNAVTPTILPVMKDVCGNVIPAPTPVISGSATSNASCSGTVIYTYTYTDCAGLSTPWVYTYTVTYSGGLAAPTNGSSTVSCPIAAINPGNPGDITDACGRTVHAVLIGSSTPPECNGDIVWTYRYTACNQTTTADWTYTYHVVYSGGLTAPTAGETTVSCPIASQTAPTVPTIQDACGRIVSGVFVSHDNAPTCNGDVVWTYRYTACDNVTTTNWTYTYHVVYSGGLTAPLAGTSTVSCPSASQIAPGAPNITDACGRTVSGVLTGHDNAPTCNGDVAWHYLYTACDNVTTANWTYTYHVVYSGGLTAPAAGSSTVSCPAQAVDPGAPANITDACGRTVSAVLVGSTTPPACNGTVVWTYRYTACDGTTTADWTYTYTIQHATPPAVPANGTGTVACEAYAIMGNQVLDQQQLTFSGWFMDINTGVGQSFTPAVDGKLGTIDVNIYTYIGSPTFDVEVYLGDGKTGSPIYSTGGYSVNSIGWVSFQLDPTQEPTLAAGTKYTFWLRPYPYNSVQVSLGYSVPGGPYAGGQAWDECTSGCDPTYNAQNYPDYDLMFKTYMNNVPVVTDACGTVIQTPTPTVGGTYNGCSGTKVYTYIYTDCEQMSSTWSYTYTILPPTVTMPDPGGSTVACVANATLPTPPTVYDNCGRLLAVSSGVPSADPQCNGQKIWTFTYTDCANIPYTWAYTYTILYSGGLTAPTAGASTVSCPSASQVAPGAPDITDACGRIVHGAYVSNDQAPSCNGDVVWHYLYTACDGTTTVPWTYTYHVVYSGGLTAPTAGETTVSCPIASQTVPTVPTIQDACGRTVSGVWVSNDPAPSCNGDVVWHYTYTACDGTTKANWTYTYHVVYSGGLTAPTAGETTVSCPIASQTAPIVPTIQDACGRIVSGVFVSHDNAPTCNGDVVWTYRYTACDNVTTTNWTYTYHVVYSGGLTAPQAGSSTVSCPSASQIAPGAPDITDACGRTVHGVYVSNDQAPTCNGDVVWHYSYMACDNVTTVPWTYTYHVVYSGGLTAPQTGSSTVSCPIASQTPPGAPDITDACGRTVHGVWVSNDPAPSCNGDVVWTYRYTACDNVTTANWTYTYHVVYSGGLTAPTAGASTVSCPAASQIAPTVPTIQDACGRTVSGVLTGHDNAPLCNGDVVWNYTYTACDNVTQVLWTYTYHVVYSGGLTAPAVGSSIVSCPASSQIAPTVPTIQDACGRTVNGVWVSNDPAPSCNGDVVWHYTYTACDNQTTAIWTYTYHVVYSGGLTAPIAGETTVSCPIASQTAPTVPTIQDACGRTVSGVLTGHDVAPTCNGDVVWHYIYTACDGTTTANWTYTYHVIYSGGLTAPTTGASTVSCPSASQVAPTVPTIQDACGRTVSGVWVSNDPAPSCNGDVVWTYRYTACDGTTTANWTYTYHVVYSGGLTAPQAGSSTVSCPSQAVNPGAPADITDACGRTVHAVLVGSTTPPACNGTVVWTYRYTACNGITIADWTYTYTINDNTPPVITSCAPPQSAYANANCQAAVPDFTATTIATDNCGITGKTQVPTAGTLEGMGTTNIVITVTDCAGNNTTCTSTFTVLGNTLNGIVTYNNSSHTPLQGVTVKLTSGSTQLSSQPSGSDGSYSISGLCLGNYTLTATGWPSKVGGINSTDAGQVQYWWVSTFQGTNPIQKVRFDAGDVDGNSGINSNDALEIQLFFVSSYMSPIFSRPPWTYWTDNLYIANNGDPNAGASTISVNLASGPNTVNVLGECTGDFNMSYIPGNNKEVSAFELIYSGTQQTEANQEIEVPVNMVNPTPVSSVSLVMNFPVDMMTIEDVTMKTTIGTLNWAVNGNELRIGWYSTVPFNVDALGDLLTIKLKTTAAFVQGQQIKLTLVPSSLNELADGNYKAISDATLSVPVVVNYPAGINPGADQDMTFQNHPNPFANITTFTYNLPAAGNAIIEIHDLLGRVVMTVLNEQETSGPHILKVDAATLPMGIYVATLKLINNDGVEARTIKIVETK